MRNAFPAASEFAEPLWSTNPRILVAEDERLVAEELRERLLRLNYAVVGMVATADDAVVLAEREQPDLVLMDIRLKGHRDGIDAAAEIGARLDVPVIFLTAHTDEATVERARKTGPYGYLVKPVFERELGLTVKMALHKHALESRLRESEERFVTTLMSIGDGVIAVDVGGRITFLNHVAETLTRWPSALAIGRPVTDVFHIIDETTRQPVPNPVVAALRDHAVVMLGEHALLVTRDGTEVPVDDSAAPVSDRRGRVAGAVLVFRDVTPRRTARAALLRAEEDLRQAQKMESLGRLSGGVAHDINNMMTVVSGCAELLLNEMGPTDPMRPLVEEIKRAGERSADVTRQLLIYSRRQILRPATHTLGAVVAGAQPMLQRLIGEDVELLCRIGPDEGMINIDRGQIEQVLLNLVVNARDAMPQGGRLVVETATVDASNRTPGGLPSGRFARLSVADTGVGMDEATRTRAFEAFFTTKDEGRGTGLGLATVYGIVHQSGGHIESESAVGHGTTFTVYLPIVDDVPPAEPGTVSPGATARPFPPSLGTAAVVLLVEDDDAVRAVAQRFLQREGHQVLATAWPADALRLSNVTEHIDLLVTDAIMPGMSGRQLAETLTAQRPGLKVLFISGYTEDAILRHGISTDQVAFVQKPFTAQALADKVREVLGR